MDLMTWLCNLPNCKWHIEPFNKPNFSSSYNLQLLKCYSYFGVHLSMAGHERYSQPIFIHVDCGWFLSIEMFLKYQNIIILVDSHFPYLFENKVMQIVQKKKKVKLSSQAENKKKQKTLILLVSSVISWSSFLGEIKQQSLGAIKEIYVYVEPLNLIFYHLKNIQGFSCFSRGF